jgi:U3 small nucleolar RNA-associated protein 25
MPASDARRRARSTKRGGGRGGGRDATAATKRPREGEESDAEEEEALNVGRVVANAGGDAYGALLASLGASRNDEEEDEDEEETSEEEEGSEEEDETSEEGEDGEPSDAEAVEEEEEEEEEEDEEEEDDEEEMEDDDGDGATEEENLGRDAGDSALERHIRRGETLSDAQAEALKTEKVSFPKPDANGGAAAGKQHSGTWEGANGLTLPTRLDAPRLCQAKLEERWKAVTGSAGFASESQADFYTMLSSYLDVQHGDRKLVPDQGPAGQQLNDETLDAVCLHVIDHVTRTRNRIMKNNESLAKKAKAGTKVLEDDLPRDQGFVRPTVLFLTPMRNMAGRAIMRLLDLCPAAHGRGDSVNKLERIEEDFLAYEGSDSDEDVDEDAGKKRKFKPFVPEDHKAIFKGNTDDHFRLGLKLTKASVRLYVDFFGADIIFASPLGLITALQDEQSASDFLSAIEICVIDHAHIIQMQNWAHVITILDAMNGLPKEMRDCDIQRVHESHLNGHARHLRQTILLSAFQTPEQNALFNRRCVNLEGKVRLRNSFKGVLGQLSIKTRQQFERINMKAADVVNSDDIRFKYFVKHVLPRIRENPEPGVVIFVSSYFDFVRVRNLLTKEDVSFAVNSEYIEPREAARARTLFADGRKRVLLLSERAHFYFRRRIKGAREICFYSLPEHAHYYPELVSYLAGSAATQQSSTTTVGHVAGVVAVFSKLDALKLERIVGTARCAKMTATSEHPMFLFV